MKKLAIITASLSIMLIINACHYNKAELVYPKNPEPCDTATISYKVDIIPIISTNCYACHSGAAVDGQGVKLDSYKGLSNMALFADLLEVIQHDPGFPQMPKDRAQLSECNIAKIRTWIRDGAPDN